MSARPRWALPIVPIAIEPTGQLIQHADGRIEVEQQFVLKDRDIERLRLGYACAKCLQVFERPWPERCFACGVSVKRDQAAYFAREYGGVEHLGSRISIADELERLKEEG